LHYRKLPKTTVIFLLLKLASALQACVILVTTNPNAITKQEALRLPVALTFTILTLILTLIFWITDKRRKQK
jgi:hypothetical protein